MSQTLTVHLEKPIVSAKISDIVGSAPFPAAADGNGGHEGINAPIWNGQDPQAQNAVLPQTCQVLKSLIDKLNQFYDTLFAEQKEEIAKLAVEIARKILMQKVQDGDYEIESIVKEALKNAPTRKDVVVHVNPEDHILCQKVQQEEPNGALAGIKFVSDPNIGRAECLLETPKGIIQSLIDEHLEQIGNVLKTAE
jgi:flagellar biosynthesis/type III secretory pathway protein FliH